MGFVSQKEYNTGVCIPERIQHSSKTGVYIVNSSKLPNRTYIYKVLQALYISVVHILKLIVNWFVNDNKHNMGKYNMHEY